MGRLSHSQKRSGLYFVVWGDLLEEKDMGLWFMNFVMLPS